eukprot:6196539-Pleurochrysis_carterae.AAC.4
MSPTQIPNSSRQFSSHRKQGAHSAGRALYAGLSIRGAFHSPQPAALHLGLAISGGSHSPDGKPSQSNSRRDIDLDQERERVVVAHPSRGHDRAERATCEMDEVFWTVKR